jgi:hypothetical protein
MKYKTDVPHCSWRGDFSSTRLFSALSYAAFPWVSSLSNSLGVQPVNFRRAGHTGTCKPIPSSKSQFLDRWRADDKYLSIFINIYV